MGFEPIVYAAGEEQRAKCRISEGFRQVTRIDQQQTASPRWSRRGDHLLSLWETRLKPGPHDDKAHGEPNTTGG